MRCGGIFSIPQFLMYTMPFSSLASASMVIGNLSSQNEILALRSSGVHVRNIFMPILIISLGFSAATLMIADRMIPYTTELYPSFIGVRVDVDYIVDRPEVYAQ